MKLVILIGGGGGRYLLHLEEKIQGGDWTSALAGERDKKGEGTESRCFIGEQHPYSKGGETLKHERGKAVKVVIFWNAGGDGEGGGTRKGVTENRRVVDQLVEAKEGVKVSGAV